MSIVPQFTHREFILAYGLSWWCIGFLSAGLVFLLLQSI